jgi:predicted CoA-binding protein
MTDEAWRANLLETPAAIAALLGRVETVAVLGIRSEAFADRPAHYVAAAVQASGRRVIPVPVHEPDVREILGEPVVRSLADVPGPVDLVDVFRRPDDVPAHEADILAKRPGAVWLQSGIRNDAVAERLARAGIQVVQDRCLMVELARL